jgi:hypothetical protein
MIAAKLFVAAVLLAVPAAADDCTPQLVDPAVRDALVQEAARQGQSCPRALDVEQLCDAVSDQIAETAPGSPNKYSYQSKIHAAACIEPSDAPEMVRGKVQAFWNREHARLNCSQLGYSIRNGHILKLAVERNSKDFVNDAVRKWKLDLNHVDPADGRTVLDYIAEERAKARGTSLDLILQRYDDLFRKNGAKRRSEL